MLKIQVYFIIKQFPVVYSLLRNYVYRPKDKDYRFKKIYPKSQINNKEMHEIKIIRAILFYSLYKKNTETENGINCKIKVIYIDMSKCQQGYQNLKKIANIYVKIFIYLYENVIILKSYAGIKLFVATM